MTKEEAIKELRGFIGQLTEGCQEVIKVLIPELGESEDERIRQSIVGTIKQCTDILDPKNQKRMLAWLEKQKEQKPAEWSEDIIRKGIKEVGLTQYQIKWLKNNVFPPKKEQKPETKITGWVARDRNGEICIYEDYPERISAQQFWFGQGSNRILDQKSFPDLKWEDEPVEVEIIIRKK